MRKLLLSMLLLVGTVIFGCKSQQVADRGSKQDIFSQIERNRSLTKQEKAFAKRYYRFFDSTFIKGTEPAENQTVPVDIDFLKSELYQKWGLGDKKDFSLKEKIYISILPQMTEAWELYDSINLDELSDVEESFLKEMHEKYGSGRINYKEIVRQEQGKLFSYQENFFDLIEAVTGQKQLDDKGLVLLYRMTPR